MLELPLRSGKSRHSYLFFAAAKPEFINEEGFCFYAEATTHDKSFIHVNQVVWEEQERRVFSVFLYNKRIVVCRKMSLFHCLCFDDTLCIESTLVVSAGQR